MMMVHVAGSWFSSGDVNSLDWQISIVYNGLVRFCVPVFIMISGSLFLQKERSVTIKSLFQKNILRIVLSLIFWAGAYVVLIFIARLLVYGEPISVATLSKNVIDGCYHLWFLPAMIGIYLTVPLLRKIAEDKTLTIYFLICSFVLSYCVNFAKHLSEETANLVSVLNYAAFDFFAAYSGYFLLGFFLAKYDLAKSTRTIIYILGALSAVFTVTATIYYSVSFGEADSRWLNYLLPGVYFQSVAVFIFFKYNVSKIKWSAKAIARITHTSALCFGMYLVHNFANLFFIMIGFTSTYYNPIISVPLHTVFVFIMSYIASYILYNIPLVNKYLM